MNDKEIKEMQTALEKNQDKMVLIELTGIVEANWKENQINLQVTEEKIVITKKTETIVAFNLHQLMKVKQETDKKIRFEFDPLQTVILTIME